MNMENGQATMSEVGFRSIYKSAAHKRELMALYDAKLESLGIPYSTARVQTFAGETNVVIAGKEGLPPVVLLHGVTANAPIALEPIAGLSAKRRIYAVDIIGQPNRSAETRLPLRGDAYGRWLDQVMDGLGLEKAPFIGVSYGAFIFQKFIAYRPDRVKAAIFVVPGGFGDGSPFKSVFRVLIPMWRYMRSGKERDLLRFMDAFYSVKDSFSVAYQKAVLHGVKMDLRRPPLFGANQGRGMQAPAYLLAIRDDIFFPGGKAEKRCRKAFPNFREAVFLEGAKHIPAPREFPEIAARIDAWLDSADGKHR